MTGRLTGTARFTAAPGGLRYAERGALLFGAYRGEASQSYVFALLTPGVAVVSFEDGRRFHTLDLRTGRTDVAHACAPDEYRGRYRVRSWDAWTLSWVIAGPRKRILIATRYSRA